jgi:hypothetical protein
VIFVATLFWFMLMQVLLSADHFAILLGKIKDGQKLPTVTCFGGTAIMARYEAMSEFADTQKYIGRSRTSWNQITLLPPVGV